MQEKIDSILLCFIPRDNERREIISAILQVVMEKSLSEEEIYNTISLSSASQMFLMNYAGEEVKRAIADMKDVANAIHQAMLKKVGKEE